MPSSNLTDSGNDAARHNPFLYYDDIQTTSRCTANVVDFGSFANAAFVDGVGGAWHDIKYVELPSAASPAC